MLRVIGLRYASRIIGPDLAKSLSYGIYLKSYSGPYYNLRYIFLN